MLKYLLLATGVAIAAPAVAQEAPSTAVPAQEIQPTEPVQSADPAQPAAPQEGQTAPAAEAAQAQPAPAQQPATSASQVATVVNAEFPKFDKDADGALDKAEFSEWMIALRKASEPAFQPDSAEAAAWNDKAFTQADIDKSASVNATELTVFLTPKPA